MRKGLKLGRFGAIALGVLALVAPVWAAEAAPGPDADACRTASGQSAILVNVSGFKARTPEPPTMPTARPAPPSVSDAARAMPSYLSACQEERGCCNGMGGPVEEDGVVVVEHFADPAGAWQRWVAPTDAGLERRYAPRPAPSLNPITLRF